MNEQMQQEILKYLQTFQSGVEKAGTFTAEQAPLVIQEFIRWEIFGNLFIGIILSLFGYYFVKLYVRLYKQNEKKSYDERNDDIGLMGVFGGIFILTIFTGVICVFSHTLKAIVAPRIVIIEKISELTNGVSNER